MKSNAQGWLKLPFIIIPIKNKETNALRKEMQWNGWAVKYFTPTEVKNIVSKYEPFKWGGFYIGMLKN